MLVILLGTGNKAMSKIESCSLGVAILEGEDSKAMIR